MSQLGRNQILELSVGLCVIQMQLKVFRLFTKKPCSQRFRQLKKSVSSFSVHFVDLIFLFTQAQTTALAINLFLQISKETPLFCSIRMIENPVFK